MPSLADQLAQTLFNAGGAVMQFGHIVRVSGDSQLSFAQADSNANLIGTLGAVLSSRVGQGAAVVVATGGRNKVRLETGLTPLAGQTIYVSAATPGLGTTVRPMNAFIIGEVIDASKYSATNPIVEADISKVSELSGIVSSNLIFQNVADMAAFDTTGLADGLVGFVRTLRRKFFYSRTSTLPNDPVNFTAVTATGGGAWIDSGDAHDSWQFENVVASTATWHVDAVNGNNENIGSAAAPIKTFHELNTRFHGLVIHFFETWDIFVDQNGLDTDPCILQDVAHATTAQLGNIRVRGDSSRTVATSGTVTAVTNLDAASNQFCLVTLNANVDAHVGKYIRFLNGATFRTAAWIAKSLGGNQYLISSPINENGLTNPFPTAIVNPVTNDNFEIYDLKTIADLILHCPQWETRAQIVNLRVTNPGGGGFTRNYTDYMWTQYLGSYIDGAMYGTGKELQEFFNCRIDAWGRSYVLQQGTYQIGGGLLTRSSTGFNDQFVDPAEPAAGVRARLFMFFYPVFQNVGLIVSAGEIENPFVAGAAPAFLDCAADISTLITFSEFCAIYMDLIWGTGNSAVAGLSLATEARHNRIMLTATPIVDAGAPEIVMRDIAGNAINCSFTDIGVNNLIDERGNEIIGPVGRTVASAVAAVNAAGATVAAGDVVKSTNAAGDFTRAQADTAGNAAGVLGVVLNTSVNGARALIAAAGSPRANYDGAVTAAAIAYLSPGTAGKLTTTVPAMAATNQKLRMGRVGNVSGTTARTAWHPENLPVTADGSP